MTDSAGADLARVIGEHESSLLDSWIERLLRDRSLRAGLMGESEVRRQGGEMLSALRAGLMDGSEVTTGPGWDALRALLREISQRRAQLGYTPYETAAFVFLLKRPLFEELQNTFQDDPARLVNAMSVGTDVIDNLGLYTMELAQKSRDAIISRQQDEILELSTPVVQLWTGILALPLIGTLDSARTQIVMEALLQEIVATGSDIAIIDITGVPAVDTAVAQHLLKTIAAARLMGADCIISGIRPQIAQTMVQLGLELEGITTKATLADAFRTALRQLGRSELL